jgi:hypothetical protein
MLGALDHNLQRLLGKMHYPFDIVYINILF